MPRGWAFPFFIPKKEKGALVAASAPFRVRRVFSVGKPLSDQRNKCERNDFD